MPGSQALEKGAQVPDLPRLRDGTAATNLMREMFLKAVDFIALAHLIVLFPIPFFWFLVHPAIGFWRRVGARPYWIALPVWSLLGALCVVERQWVFAGRIQRSAWTWGAGAGLFLFAIWLELKRRRHFSPKLLLGLAELEPGHPAGALIRSGVYGYVRHPRYLECMMTLLAFAALTGCARYFLLAILSILLYQIVAPLEERELCARYGEAYKAYAREVPRFLPRLVRRREPQV
jgi:protein-S-isoprenylcysteine O-methyltransferase Ste14